MENFYKRSVLLATTALGLGLSLASPALAQDAEGGDIIVTARRIEERLQDVPISITVFNQDQLDDRNVRDLTDLATYTPSLQTNNEYGTSTQASFSIRGFVQDVFTAPSVGVYFADVVAPRSATSLTAGEGAGPGAMFDLQNVQVLKGPQGTLFGRNTTGGAVLLVPQKPTEDFEGYLEGSIGNFDMERTQGVVNIPLSPNARLRMGFDQMNREGYQNNISDIGPEHFGDVNYWAGRISFVANLTPNLENYSILSYVQSDTNGGLNAVTECNTADNVFPFGPFNPYRGFNCGQVARRDAAHDFYAVDNALIDPLNRMRQWQFVNTTTWDVSDNLTIKNIASYAEVRNDVRNEIFGNAWEPSDADTNYTGLFGSAPPPGPRYIPFGAIEASDLAFNDSSTLTEEIQFQGNAFDNRLTWQAGVYYEKVGQVPSLVGAEGFNFGSCDASLGWNSATNAPTNVDGCYFAAPNLGRSGSTIGREVRTSEFIDQAVYAQGTYNITDRLSATLGLRYTDDTSTATSTGYTFPIDNFGFGNFLGDGTVFVLSGGLADDRPYCSDPTLDIATTPDCTRSFRQHSNATTGEFVLEYQATDNTNTYIKYARGYRQGMVNPRGIDFLVSFGQEQVDLYEIGVKTNWRGSTPGYLNVALFHNLFQNQQLGIAYAANLGGSPTAGICACGKSVINGVELDGSISPFEGFRLSGALAYLNTDLKEFSIPPGPPGYSTPTTVFVRDLPFSPEWKYSITPSYTLPLPESIGEITLSATYSYTDAYNNRGAIIPAYDLLNLNANWNHMFGSPVDLSLFGTNVTDEEYIVAKNNSEFDSVGFTNVTLGEPKMYGVRLRYNFGARN